MTAKPWPRAFGIVALALNWSEDFIAEQAKGGGLDVEFENGDTATFYFEEPRAKPRR